MEKSTASIFKVNGTMTLMMDTQYCHYCSPQIMACVQSVFIKTKLNSVALVRERTIPTERPPPVGEVSANFLRIEGCHVVSATDPHGR